MTDKKTNVTTNGRFGFTVEADNYAKIIQFFYEVDPAVISTEEFLKSDYKKNSQIQLTAVYCDENMVTYQYLKPDSLRGQTSIFRFRGCLGKRNKAENIAIVPRLLKGYCIVCARG